MAGHEGLSSVESSSGACTPLYRDAQPPTGKHSVRRMKLKTYNLCRTDRNSARFETLVHETSGLSPECHLHHVAAVVDQLAVGPGDPVVCDCYTSVGDNIKTYRIGK